MLRLPVVSTVTMSVDAHKDARPCILWLGRWDGAANDIANTQAPRAIAGNLCFRRSTTGRPRWAVHPTACNGTAKLLPAHLCLGGTACRKVRRFFNPHDKRPRSQALGATMVWPLSVRAPAGLSLSLAHSLSPPLWTDTLPPAPLSLCGLMCTQATADTPCMCVQPYAVT